MRKLVLNRPEWHEVGLAVAFMGILMVIIFAIAWLMMLLILATMWFAEVIGFL